MLRLNQRGVTLLELLIAMTILAVALVGLAGSFPLAMYAVSLGGYQTTASLLGQQCIELGREIIQQTTLTTSNLTAACPAVPQSGGGVNYTGFTRTVLVQNGDEIGASPALSAILKVITVTVEFRSDPFDPSPTISTTLRSVLTPLS